MFLSKLPQVFVHDLTSPCALSPEMNNHILALFSNIKELLLLDHAVLPMSNSELFLPIACNGLHLFKAFPAELFEIVNLQCIELANLFIKHLLAIPGNIR